MQALAGIIGYLQDFRRRRVLVLVVRDSGVVAAGLALALLALLLLAASLPARRILQGAGVALLAFCGIGLAVHLGLALRRLRRTEHLARLVGRMRPDLYSDLLSAVQLGRERGGRFSRALYRALADRTLGALRSQTAASLVPASALRPAAVALAVACCSWAAAGALAPGSLDSGARRLVAIGGDLDGPRVAAGPLVGDLTLSYRYPAYMSRPDQQVTTSSGQITAPRGTRVRLEATALLPLARAWLVLREERGGQHKERRLALDRGERGTLKGSLKVTVPGSYRFEVQPAGGRRRTLDPVQRLIRLEPDAAPQVQLFGPRDGVEVTRQHRLELGYSAEDDHGLSEVRLAFQVGAARVQRSSLWRPGRGQRQRKALGNSDWDLGSLDLKPGTVVTYWIEALDNDTVSGPKRGASSTLQVKVYSAEEKHAEALRLQQRALDQGVRTLAARLLLFEKQPPLSPALRLARNRTVHASQMQFLDLLRELRNRMQQDVRAAPAVRRSINRMQLKMWGLLEQEAELLKREDPIRRRQPVRLGPLRSHNRLLVLGLERDVLRLADLLDEQRLQVLSTLGQQIAEGRKRLARLLARYRKQPTDALRAEIQREIRHLQRLVAQLQSQMSRLSASIPDEYLNVEALGNMDLGGHLRRIQQQVQEGRLDGLQASLEALDGALSRLQGMLGGNLQRFRGNRMSEREQRYSRALDALRGLEREQREIAGRTGRIISGYRRNAAKLMKRTIAPFTRRQLARLAELRRRVDEVEARGLNPYDQEQLLRIKQRVRDLKGMLAQGDLDQALNMARRTHNALRVLEDDLQEEDIGRRGWRRGRSRRSHRRCRAARKLAGEMVNDLQAIFPRPGAMLDRSSRQQLRGLLRRQQSLRKRAQQLGGKLKKEGDRGVLGQEQGRQLDEAGEIMGQASGKLRQLRLQEAHGHQQAAAERLARLQKQVRQARQPRRVAGSGGPGLRERIKIPGADTFRPPREFRQDILEAMKEKAPGDYRKSVRRYYEELVR